MLIFLLIVGFVVILLCLNTPKKEEEKTNVLSLNSPSNPASASMVSVINYAPKFRTLPKNYSVPASHLIKTPEWTLAEKFILEGKNVFIHGKPGTGKSYFINYIKQHPKFKTEIYQRAKLAVITPTGISALNVKGQTVFSCLWINYKNYSEPFERRRALRSRIASIETFIIDEISMIRADLLDTIDERLRDVFSTSRPFGGKQIIVVGDFYQLPPVLDENSDYIHDIGFIKNYGKDKIFCFNSPAFRTLNFVNVEFTRVFRQENEEFIKNLTLIREGNVNDLQFAIDYFNKRLIAEYPEKTPIITPHRKEADDINMDRLSKLPTKEYISLAKHDDKSDWESTSSVPPMELKLKEKAFVMFIKNDEDKKWVNGTVGLVEHIKADRNGSIENIKVRTNDGLYSVLKETWHKVKMDRNGQQVDDYETYYTQFPLQLAWATTIHKAQGITLERVCVDLGTRGAFTSGQLYVALSRVRDIKGMFLKEEILPEDIMTDSSVRDFVSSCHFMHPEILERKGVANRQ